MNDSIALPARIGCYEATETLGRGAMSMVYRAVDTRSGAAVALKLARRDTAANTLRHQLARRFEREAEIGRRIVHPHVIRVLGAGTHQGLPYLAMEFIDGPTLTTLLERGPVLADHAITVAAGLAETLADLHQAGIVHRDVKPQNVLLRRPLEPVITDFGVAQYTDMADELAIDLAGTPASMAPEQIRGDRLDGRADVFALGVLLYRLITGRRPFDGPAARVAHQILHVDPLPPSRLAPTLPPVIDAILDGALAKDPDRRYGAAELADELRALLRSKGQEFSIPGEFQGRV